VAGWAFMVARPPSPQRMENLNEKIEEAGYASHVDKTILSSTGKGSEAEMALYLLRIGTCPFSMVVPYSRYSPICQYVSTEFFTSIKGI
jgi:hypothetical protein